MQPFTPYFAGYENQQQPQTSQPQQQPQTNQPQDHQQPQQPQPPQPLSMNGPNLAIYSPAAMQPLSVLTAPQTKPDQSQPPMGTPPVDLGAHGKPKRKQVKNACVNCQKACKKCDEGRPCQRCIKYGITDTCVNSVRKERKKGIKRGPYKKRNKNGVDSATSSGTSTPNMASPMTSANIYAPNNSMRAPNTMPIHYQPFTQPAYDPYGYANNGQMMPQAYMVPAATIQQMYPTNPPVLSYQAAMNIISPQQQQQQHHQQQQQQQQAPSLISGNYRPQEQQPQPPQQQQQPSTDPSVNAANTSATGTPTNSTPAHGGDNLNGIKAEDDDDEGSKLTILSQLCSAVLDRNDAPKQDTMTLPTTTTTEEIKQEEAHQNTPPPSRPHSRETSHDNNTNNVTMPTTSGPNFGADSPHTYVNGHLAHRGPTTAAGNSPVGTPHVAYGTPGSSPSESPVGSLHFNHVPKPQPWMQQATANITSTTTPDPSQQQQQQQPQ
ncbi:uncharacterized protein BX663DRAFT_548081 [Cokeromyces recurvatus]|uniref:uncharacterized protein n=1 Tax=Cokeromyces recurvatus TaxID=90255 RepID=UPI00221F1C26|nr:uncharacterized protein BX663DRAFT_548081 [Cokeromyces recurvatus]KAI7906984.1 hypothetical protein BX663DRAFT_548081 [Cokeromyces recurvatus]